MSSTIPAARANLVAGLAALQATTLSGVRVDRTGIWDERPEYDRIAVLNARNIQRDWSAGLGQQRLEEMYDLPVTVETFLPGDDITAAETRLWVLVGIVEKYVLGSGGTRIPTLGGAVRVATPIGAPDGEESGPVDDKTVVARVTVLIRCEARVDLSV